MSKDWDSIVAKEIERIEQLKRRKQINDNQAKEEQRKLVDRITFRLGRIVLKHFPKWSTIQPAKTNAANDRRFAHVDEFFRLLASNENLVFRLEVEAKKMLSEEAEIFEILSDTSE